MGVKLYSKIGEEKKIRFVDPVKKTVMYNKPAIFLHPTKPVEVSEADAEHLLKQDPHLVSKKPFKGELEDVVEHSKPRDYQFAAEEPETLPESVPDEQKIKTLHELAEVDVSKLKAKDVDRFAKELGIVFPPKMPFMAKKKTLLEKANEMAKELVK